MESMSLIVEAGVLLERGPCMSLEVLGIQRRHRLAALCLPESVASSVKLGKSPLPCKFVRVRALAGVRLGASVHLLIRGLFWMNGNPQFTACSHTAALYSQCEI